MVNITGGVFLVVDDLIKIPSYDPVAVFQKESTLHLIKILPEAQSFLPGVCGVHSCESESWQGGQRHSASDRLS
ncbi:hypothetical protein DY000_02044833 [Brassica cretica]|uniref:Uncharacterized protein n=1 Tax=Brassica cretica TaxID=69181 RepID=A0ABQ7F2N2_BRACR|nr:hypothetical protein DY000_02044833 [Brassica cretica]